MDLIAKILVDYKSQKKRTEMILTFVRKSHLERLREICKEHELYMYRRYFDGPKDEKYEDIEILKYDKDA
jgi:hypothetical protein